MKRTAIKKQQGVVLLWALAILLVLTLLGISSMKKANMGTRIAGNSMASMMVFQGAESALGRLSNVKDIFETAKLGAGNKYTVPQADLPNEPVSGGNIKSKGTIMYLDSGACPSTNIANSSSAKCHIYEIEVESRLQGTGARTEHVLGVAKPIPSSTNVYMN